MTIAEAAEIVLKESNKPLHVKELVNLIESKNLFSFGAKSPESILSRTLSKKPENFEKTAQSTFMLKS